MEHKTPSCNEEELIAKWLGIAEEARQQVLREFEDKPVQVQAHACEQSAILVSLENLMSYPWISSRVHQDKLALHGWYFDMPNGELYEYRPQSGVFEVLVDNLEGAACQA